MAYRLLKMGLGPKGDPNRPRLKASGHPPSSPFTPCPGLAMFEFGRQVLALTAALLLALPPGWCCLVPDCAKPAPVRPACCPAHKTAPSGGTQGKETDPARQPTCECPSDTSLGPAPPAVDSSLLAPALVAVVAAPEPAAAPTDGGRPPQASLLALHLLHHVWLC